MGSACCFCCLCFLITMVKHKRLCLSAFVRPRCYRYSSKMLPLPLHGCLPTPLPRKCFIYHFYVYLFFTILFYCLEYFLLGEKGSLAIMIFFLASRFTVHRSTLLCLAAADADAATVAAHATCFFNVFHFLKQVGEQHQRQQ